MHNLHFPKRNGTHADVLAAVGAGDLLKDLAPELMDVGNDFIVRLCRDIDATDLVDIGPGFKYLQLEDKARESDKASKPGKRGKRFRPEIIPSSHVFDYASENEKYKRQQAAKRNRDVDIAEIRQQDEPDPEFRSYRIARVLQADSGLNNFLEEWFQRSPEERQSAIWKSFNEHEDFFFDAPLVQLFNPQAAKGYALLKPTGTDRNDKTKDKWGEPFHEWLRCRGFFAGCAGWFLGSKGEHVRVYCPIPAHIPFRLYQRVIARFRAESLAGSGAKMDCLGTLRLARMLIENSETFARPARSISGVWVTHYQSMGQAKAVTGIDRLAVPDWFDLRSTEDAELWLETLDEHDKVLRRLNDDVSEELALLKQYRRFLQERGKDALAEFVQFLAAYGHYVFRLRGHGKWLLPQFRLQAVEAILQPSYAEILANPGFQAIAGALRSATVSAQVAKRKVTERKGGDYREIQYGALPELTRKISAGGDEFMRAVADFITGFNAESARRYEMGKSGFRISQDDFARFAELLDKAPTELVGSLLCAMATCKLGKEDKEDIAE